MAYPVSDRFKSAITESHTMAIQVDAYAGGDTPEMTLSTVIEGQVTEDKDGRTRRRATLTVVDETGSLTPKDATELFAPFGNEFRPYRGIEFPDGTQELVPQGVFVWTSVTISDTGPELRIDTEGLDRSIRFQRDKFRTTHIVPKNTDLDVAMQDIAMSTLPDIDMVMTPAESFVTPRLIFDAGTSKWEALLRLAVTCGCDLFFDVLGRLILTPPQDYNTIATDWFVNENNKSIQLYFERTMKLDDEFANDVIVYADGTDNNVPLWAEIFDDRPGSPTSIAGKLGPVVQVIKSNEVKSTTQAVRVATSELNRRIALYEDIDFLVVPNPAMQAGDVVEVTRSASKLENTRLVLDQVSQPLVALRGGEGMSRRRIL